MNVLAILITFAAIIFVHELGHFLMARRVGVHVEVFSLGFGPKLLSWTRSGTEYCIALLPLGGYVKMAGEGAEEAGAPKKHWEFRAKSVGARFGIAVAGPVMNYLFAFVLFTLAFMLGGSGFTVPTEARVGKVLENYPAQIAGFKVGDKILAVNGEEVAHWADAVEKISSQTEAISFSLDRNGTGLSLEVTPQRVEAVDAQGKQVEVGRIGIFPMQKNPPLAAMSKAGQEVWNLTAMTVQAITQLVTGQRAIGETFGGPVRIFMWTSAAASLGVIYLMQFIAVLSVALGFFNFLPIPVLDGGHMAFLLVEKLKGTPLSVRVQEGLTWVGLSLILLLLVTVTYNDLVESYKGFKQSSVVQNVSRFFSGESSQ